MMVVLFVIGAFIPRTFLRTAGVFCAEDHGKKDETVQELINKLDAMSMNW